VDSVGLATDDLRRLAVPLTPTASVYIGLPPAVAAGDTGPEADLRWQALADRLAAQGADPATVDALAAFLAGFPVSRTELVAFAAGGAVIAAQQIPGGASFDRASFAAPPDFVPLLAWLQRHPAHVVAVTDRTGADITATRHGRLRGTRSVVMGPDDEIERNAPGGWSQPRYHRRAEDSWRHNAGAVAGAVTHGLQTVHSGLLLVAGDVRAVQLLRDRLPRTVTVRHLPGGRSEDGSAQARRVAIAAALDAYAAEQGAQLLDRFTAERGPHGATVEGVSATLAALAEGRVQTLLVADDPADDRLGWFGTGVLCVDDPSQVPPGTAGELYPGRLVDVAVRAALLTDAEVRVVDPGAAVMGDRIGALCRYE
jgi:hypothetical protein